MSAIPWQRIFDIAYSIVLIAAAIWVGWRTLKKSVEPVGLILKWILTAALILGTMYLLRSFPAPMWPVVVLIPAVTIGFMWAPSIGSALGNLMSGGMDGGGMEVEPHPFYSIAEAKRRNGHPQEAIQAVRAQLEKFPGDLQGVLLLASIQAEDLNDLSGAQTTIEKWIEQPAATPQGIVSALTTIADWQLEFAQDPEAARAALEQIVQTFPDTPFAHQAAQRLAHLPTVEHLLSASAAGTFSLRPGEKDVGLRQDYTGPTAPVADPAARAENLVKQLQAHPADTDAREELAVLYAGHFSRMDLAVEQLEQLINLPNETPKHIAHWLNLLADLHIKFGKDEAAAAAALRRILDQFSTPALVQPTQARLAALGAEMKAGHQPKLKVLGQYEKNIGLKKTTG